MVLVKRLRRCLATGCRRLADWFDVNVERAIDPDILDDEVTLSETDYQALSSEFKRHTEAVHTQVSRYADVLAGEDPVLRQRLRQFEGGGRS